MPPPQSIHTPTSSQLKTHSGVWSASSVVREERKLSLLWPSSYLEVFQKGLIENIILQGMTGMKADIWYFCHLRSTIQSRKRMNLNAASKCFLFWHVWLNRASQIENGIHHVKPAQMWFSSFCDSPRLTSLLSKSTSKLNLMNLAWCIYGNLTQITSAISSPDWTEINVLSGNMLEVQYTVSHNNEYPS